MLARGERVQGFSCAHHRNSQEHATTSSTTSKSNVNSTEQGGRKGMGMSSKPANNRNRGVCTAWDGHVCGMELLGQQCPHHSTHWPGIRNSSPRLAACAYIRSMTRELKQTQRKATSVQGGIRYAGIVGAWSTATHRQHSNIPP